MKTLLKILFMILLVSQTVSPQQAMLYQSYGISDLLPTFENNPFSIKSGSIGIRAGVGTDINLGLAYGGGINYLINLNNNAIELGFVVFAGHSEETTEEFNTYIEKTDVMVFGVLANYLYGYKLKKSGLFGVIGLGFAGISVDWEESSPNDISLGTPLPGGGSKQSSDGTGAGSVFNLGFGMAFNGGLDIRAEAPVIFIFGPPGGASAIIPTFMATIGYHF
jgi:hypothetical protein